MAMAIPEMERKSQIVEQTRLLKKELETDKHQEMIGRVNETKTHYQQEMTESLKTFNTYLLFFYYFLFILIHVLFAEQYFSGIKRNELVDSLWFTWFFIYPAVIYHLESYIYFAFSYIASFIYGKSYVYDFNSLFVNTDFYKEPEPTNDGIPTITAALT
jgi:hypothetical protein